MRAILLLVSMLLVAAPTMAASTVQASAAVYQCVGYVRSLGLGPAEGTSFGGYVIIDPTDGERDYSWYGTPQEEAKFLSCMEGRGFPIVKTR